MAPTLRIAIEDPSQIAEARRAARTLADQAGFDATRAEQVAIVVTEAGSNILKHAKRGEILVGAVPSANGIPTGGIEMLALDRGPGIENIAKCMADGYSTGGSPGEGLGAIFRLSTLADIYSVAGKGTGVIARWNGTPHARHELELVIGAVNICKTGQTFCGDSWGVVEDHDFTTVLVADGLGHGYEASLASQEAVRVLREQRGYGPKELLELVHLALRSSRGAAVAVARIDRMRRTLSFAGAGNIAAQTYSGAQPRQHLVSVNGTAGHQVQQLREFNYPWPDKGMLILHSDGLVSATGLEGHPGLALRDPSLIAGLLYRDYARGNDDATVVVVKDG